MGKDKKIVLRDLENAIRPKAKEVKRSLCSFSFLVSAVKTLGCVIFYYCFSIGLTFYNQRFIHVSFFLFLLFDMFDNAVYHFCTKKIQCK